MNIKLFFEALWENISILLMVVLRLTIPFSILFFAFVKYDFWGFLVAFVVMAVVLKSYLDVKDLT